MRSFASVIALILLAANAAAEESGYPYIMEELPPHLEARRDENRDAIMLDAVEKGQGYYLTLTRFEPGEPIRVCFFEGSTALRKKIIAIANRWAEIPETSLKLDFGDPASPRTCSSREFNHIRVGFRYKGYWSLVGRESVELAPQAEQTINFERFNTVPPPSQRFERVVLHEFGHALGMYHEHQNEIAHCEKEYKWETVKADLMGPPNFWTVEQVDHNMLPRPGLGESGPFDVKSIMIYSFPPTFYVKGETSPCFATEASALSDGDIAGLRQLFPKDFSSLPGGVRKAALDQYLTKVDALPGIENDRKDLAKSRAAKIAGAPQQVFGNPAPKVVVNQPWKPGAPQGWVFQPYAMAPGDGNVGSVWGYAAQPPVGWGQPAQP